MQLKILKSSLIKICKIILCLMVLKLELVESYKDPFDAYFARRCVESQT